MKKVISYSLWGDNLIYNIGAIRNVEIASIFYPDFECWFYVHKESVPEIIIERLSKFNNTKIIFKEGDLNNSKPMMWRFEAILDPEVEIMLSRDTDSRFLVREKLAVEEWLNSKFSFHIMRDHPYHTTEILGGMFGTKKNPKIDWETHIKNCQQIGARDYDQYFLKEIIYPLIEDDCLIHASFWKKEDFCQPFPIGFENDYKFVGGHVYPNESINVGHCEHLKNNYNGPMIGANYYNNNFIKHLKSNIKIIFEVGANHGDESIVLSKLFNNSQIYSFECNPKTINLCKEKLEPFKNITFCSDALGDKNEMLPFYSFNLYNLDGPSSLLKRIDFAESQKENRYVRVRKMIDFINDNNIKMIDLLCLCVQGYELNVLKGAENFIKNIKYIILQEPKPIINQDYLPKNTHSKYIKAPSSNEIKQFMTRCNFIEIERLEENLIEDKVMYKNVFLC